jgi:glycosyltransferase involved in cell wall biosynthesis
MIKACTIAARNYVAHVRVLASSFYACHPDGRFAVLLVDDDSRTLDPAAEGFECLWLSDIGLDRAEIHRLAAIYDVTELATAVKPPLLRHLLRRDRGPILYLDPDIRIYESIEELSRLAIEHGIVLTPHVTAPMPRDGWRIDEFQVLGSGIYNLGFIGVGAGSEKFLEWWWTKTQREALSDPSRMMFTDQRWADFVPAFYKHFILKDTSYNVAYWNLHNRRLTTDGQRYFIDDRPLRFFHFSGFEAQRPFLLSKHQGDRPRILLSENPALDKICREYAGSLEEAGHSRESQRAYGWKTTSSGLPLDRRMRRLFRDGLKAHEAGSGLEPPSPFDAGASPGFMEWLREPVPVGSSVRVPRYFHSIYRDRIDLQHAFPDLASEDRSRFFDWVRLHGAKEEGVPRQLLRALPETCRVPEPVSSLDSASAAGLNIVGYFRADLGVGEAARLLTSAVEAAEIPHSTVNYGATLSRQGQEFSGRGAAAATYDINVLCVNADSTPEFAKSTGPGFFQRRYTVGYWFWELEQFPFTQHAAFDYVDEVWTATRFVASGIRAVGCKPVHTIPLPVPTPKTSPHVTRESLGLPSGFIFLFMFDFFSVIERKNPIGLIAAFERAFRPNEGPTLVLKTINGGMRLNDLEQVRAAARRRPDILIIDGYYSAQEKNSLLGLCDCYVSLHRSEGLGLTMAEAMALEKPVIATGYSGNLDFMTSKNSYLVDYVTGTVPAGCHPYPEGTPWAEPNLDRAAEYMRQVYLSPREAAARAARARCDLLTRHDAKSAGRTLARRLDQIRAKPDLSLRRAGSAEASPAMRTLLPGLEQIAALVTPAPSVAPGRPLRRPLLTAQKLLFRLLRPYWWQQRNVHRSLIAAMQTHMLRMQGLEADLKRLEAQVDALLEYAARLEQR